MEQPVVRAAGSDRMTHLLQDLAPEIALRWVARTASLKGTEAPSPELCRGLVSMLLRASLPSDAIAALDVLEATSALPEEAPLARLGFSAKIPLSTFHAVLEDLLESAILRQPLLLEGPALTFYSTAGVGSSDDAEYEGAQDGHCDAHLKFRIHEPKLANVRERNVVLALGYFSTVLRLMSKKPMFAEISPVTGSMPDDRRRRLWKLLYQALAHNIQYLPPDSVRAIQSLFGALMECEPVERQDEVANELVTVFNTLAMQRSSSVLGLYARSIFVCNVRMKACIISLVRLFKAKDGKSSSSSERMTVLRFANNFLHPVISSKMDSLALHAVPALITTLGETWLALADTNDFVVEREKVSGVIERLNAALGRLEQQASGCVPRDILTTRIVITAVCDRVAKASGSVM